MRAVFGLKNYARIRTIGHDEIDKNLLLTFQEIEIRATSCCRTGVLTTIMPIQILYAGAHALREIVAQEKRASGFWRNAPGAGMRI